MSHTRTLWGIPKELATFDWRESSPYAKTQWNALTVTDDATGVQFLNFNVTGETQAHGSC